MSSSSCVAPERAAPPRRDGRPLQILRLTPHFYWPQLAESSWPVRFDAVGGMQTQIHRIVAALSDEGVEQTVVTLKVVGAPRRWRMTERVDVRGVRVPVLPLRSRVRGMVDLNLAWALGVAADTAVRRRPVDLVHVHCSGVLWPLVVAAGLRRALDVPLVLTLHCSTLVTYHAMNDFDRIVHPIARAAEVRAIRAASHVVTLTPRVAPALARAAGIPAERVSVLPDTIDAGAFAAGASRAAAVALRQRWRVLPDRRVVGFVGRVAREKGWPAIVDAAALLRDQPIHWLVCGDGNERRALESRIAAEGLRERFTVTGYLPNDEVATAMTAMDLLVLPSQHEEFGGVMLEAMATRLPIVAFDVGGVPAVLEHGRLGALVGDRTGRGLAAAVEAALADPAWRADVTARAARAVSRYDTAIAARRLVSLYRAAVS